ncbi:MAG: DUF72 domain-containing protein [Gemmatimonadaceae bacterium]
MLYVGTAGWSIPKLHADAFPAEGSHLARYAARLPAVEINSSFYRPHRPATYARWAASVPDGFRFSAKVPKAATHEARLRGPDAVAALERFLGEVRELGDRLGPLLVQLPPKLSYDGETARAFLGAMRERFDGLVALEPRHATWFDDEAARLLVEHRVARVAADPPKGAPAAADPGGWDGLVYIRWHGSPKMYYSPYPPEELEKAAAALRAARGRGAEAWAIFDNTADGHAWGDALAVWALSGPGGPPLAYGSARPAFGRGT